MSGRIDAALNRSLRDGAEKEEAGTHIEFALIGEARVPGSGAQKQESDGV